jgi:hypothetical protein
MAQVEEIYPKTPKEFAEFYTKGFNEAGAVAFLKFKEKAEWHFIDRNKGEYTIIEDPDKVEQTFRAYFDDNVKIVKLYNLVGRVIAYFINKSHQA